MTRASAVTAFELGLAGAFDLAGMTATALPSIARLLGAHLSLSFVKRDGAMYGFVADNDPAILDAYGRYYGTKDPLHEVSQRWRTAVAPLTQAVERRKLERTEIYADFYSRHRIPHQVCVRVNSPDGASVGLLFGRDAARGEFDRFELQLLESLVPSLRAAAGRLLRAESVNSALVALDRVLALEPKAHVVFDADGRVLWAAPSTVTRFGGLLADLRTATHPVAQSVRDLTRGRQVLPGATRIQCRVGGETAWVELALLAERAPPLVIAHFTPHNHTDPLESYCVRRGLTRAEVVVARWLIEGNSNVDIGRHLYLSEATVRTHLTRIYKKLGASSRAQAIVIIRSALMS